MLPRQSAILLHFVSPPHYFRYLIKPRRRQQAIVHALFSLKARFFKCMVACVAKVFAISIKMKYTSFFCCPFHPKPTFFSFHLRGTCQIDEQEEMCLERFKQQWAPQKQQVPSCKVSPGWEGNELRYAEPTTACWIVLLQGTYFSPLALF